MRADLEYFNLDFKFLFSYSGFTIFSSQICCDSLLKRLHGISQKKKYCEILAQAQPEARVFMTSVLNCKASGKF